MATVILLIHLMIAAAMVAVILLQRTEGGALGIGGGGGGGGAGFMTGRGSGNALTRLTVYMAMAFFATSIALSLMAREDAPPSIFEGVDAPGPQAPGPQAPTGNGVLPPLQQPPAAPQEPSGPQVPQSQ